MEVKDSRGNKLIVRFEYPDGKKFDLNQHIKQLMKCQNFNNWKRSSVNKDYDRLENWLNTTLKGIFDHFITAKIED